MRIKEETYLQLTAGMVTYRSNQLNEIEQVHDIMKRSTELVDRTKAGEEFDLRLKDLKLTREQFRASKEQCLLDICKEDFVWAKRLAELSQEIFDGREVLSPHLDLSLATD